MENITLEQIDSVSADGIITYTLPSQTATISLDDLKTAQADDQERLNTAQEGVKTIQEVMAARQLLIDAAFAKQV